MPKAAKKPRIGAHVPTSGGMAKRAIEYAKTIKAEAIQVFASNPRGWAMPETNHEADQAFIEKANELEIETYIHAPFLINLGSPTEGTYKNSLASTKYSLKRGREIKAKGVVIHTGSAVDEGNIKKAWKQIHEGMMPILSELDDQDPWLLLEPTAGQGQSLVKRLEDLNNYFEALEWHPKVGICLDTCHVFAAGHDIKSKGGMSATIDLLVEVAGAARIQLIHANDSMDVLGSLKDRHQNLGDGEIGSKPFAELLAHPAIVDAPLILETPGEELEHGREVAMLMKMRDK
ncbi:MAG: deoxyribonuclease IV [Candidatus Nanopelagicaceae bacterium]|nr:deoxyribonuclease IV [Candidatus Nanopelagicales bacterium]MDP4864502.1 deoxyribonuclease IV [Candidatus Nanopelagicaceae bacterium]HAG54005.1 endonuclease IV [Actinomycetota bacterium]MDP4652771.1 deoxyribonuclease IV [Candidatus Nanopelagicales bacterium]MDP4931023.1 deoxyribonuclease IV [Candidatus Nanopelagicaceae bacterium]